MLLLDHHAAGHPPRLIHLGRDLTAVIGAFIDHWNQHPVPFTWTKDPDEILASIKRAKTKASGLTGH